MDLLIVAVCTVLFQNLRREEMCSFSFEMFNILKIFIYKMKFIRGAW